MSGRIAYIERAEGMSGATRLRLVGERHDEVLNTGSALSPEETAQWLLERLPKGPSGAPLLDLLCVDIEGSLCAWLTTPTTDQSVIDVLARERTDSASEGDDEGGATVLGVYAGVPQDSSVQALAVEAPAVARRAFSKAKAPPKERRRVPVLATSDVEERLVLDALDKAGVSVSAVTSLWHSMAAAWDPASSVPVPAADDRVVSNAGIATACVILDPRGRLLWAWSQSGALLAGGAILLRRGPGEGSAPCIYAHDISRLAAEWLSWSAQLNVAPQRVIVVTSALVAENPGELDTPRFGEAIGRAWPGAVVDLAVDEDPLGATFRRAAAQATNAQEAGAQASSLEPTRSLVALSKRPGRAHFRFYVWAALAVGVAAAGIGVEAWRIRADAKSAAQLAAMTAKQWRDEFGALNLTTQALPGQELLVLESEVAKKQKELRPEGLVPAKPILKEIETLSHVLALEDFDLAELALDSKGSPPPRLVVFAPNLTQGEQLYAAIQQIAGSSLDWRSDNYDQPRQSDGKVRCQFTADWNPAKPVKPVRTESGS